jgi:hypothetical protein
MLQDELARLREHLERFQQNERSLNIEQEQQDDGSQDTEK